MLAIAPATMPAPGTEPSAAATRLLMDTLLRAQGKVGVDVFWPQHGDEHSRCKKMTGDKFIHKRKLTQRQCEIRATNQGFLFYSFDASGGKCLLTKACDNPNTNAVLPFKIFKNQQQFPADVMACNGGAALTTVSMTEDEYLQISTNVRLQLRTLPDVCNAIECPQADWAGCVLRMAGNDFMDFRPGDGGGSDGCLDFGDVNNKGLQACLNEGEFGKSLKDTYQPVCNKVSLADFLVIAAEAVIIETRKNAGAEVDFKSDFKFGRTTNTSCVKTHGRLPNPESGCGATDLVFNQFMGLDWHQTAALMAVHSMGRAKPDDSGYDGWSSDLENSRKFNNNYFVSLLSKSWSPETKSQAKAQWNRNDIGKESGGARHEMMLNTDMCLVFKDISAAEAVASSTCSCVWLRSESFLDIIQAQNLETSWCGGSIGPFFAELGNCCPSGGSDCDSLSYPDGPALAAVKLFAADEDKWINVFKQAWGTATTNGAVGLRALTNGTWPLLLKKHKCVLKPEVGDQQAIVQTQVECEGLAVSLNFPVYSYRVFGKKCSVHRDCEEHVHTKDKWMVFMKPDAISLTRPEVLPVPRPEVQVQPIPVTGPGGVQVQPIPIPRPSPEVQYGLTGPALEVQPLPISPNTRPGMQVQPVPIARPGPEVQYGLTGPGPEVRPLPISPNTRPGMQVQPVPIARPGPEVQYGLTGPAPEVKPLPISPTSGEVQPKPLILADPAATTNTAPAVFEDYHSEIVVQEVTNPNVAEHTSLYSSQIKHHASGHHFRHATHASVGTATPSSQLSEHVTSGQKGAVMLQNEMLRTTEKVEL